MTSPQDEMVALAERCEKATGPDRDLDYAIADAVLGPVKAPYVRGKCERYTASLDAAMTLVPEGQRRVEFGTYNGGDCWAYVHIGSERDDQLGESDGCYTEALALCSAALKARAAYESTMQPLVGDES